jgi:hypothetical protein
MNEHRVIVADNTDLCFSSLDFIMQDLPQPLFSLGEQLGVFLAVEASL